MLTHPPQIASGGYAARFRFGIRTHDKDADAGLRRGEPLRGTEALTVGVHDLGSALVIDKMREGEGAAEIGGKDRALVARSEEPHLRACLSHGHDANARERMICRHLVVEEADEIGDLVREMLDADDDRPRMQELWSLVIGP